MSNQSSYLTTDVTISMSDLVHRDLTEDFVNDIFKKFSDINDHVGITSREYAFPKKALYSQIIQHFEECNYPQALIITGVFSVDKNILEVTAYPSGSSYKPVKIFSESFLK